ncbi:MAG TPA: hypothetical protein VKD65_09930 [Candidatus Angelobacter sp.]|nr:hypothetical protein [Candidatus Angelobacter sp.]
MLLGLFAFEAQVFGNEQGLKARYSSPETRLFLGRNGGGGLARPAASGREAEQIPPSYSRADDTARSLNGRSE